MWLEHGNWKTMGWWEYLSSWVYLCWCLGHDSCNLGLQDATIREAWLFLVSFKRLYMNPQLSQNSSFIKKKVWYHQIMRTHGEHRGCCLILLACQCTHGLSLCHPANNLPEHTGLWCNWKWGPAAHCSKANKEARLVESLLYFGCQQLWHRGCVEGKQTPEADSSPLTIRGQGLL